MENMWLLEGGQPIVALRIFTRSLAVLGVLLGLVFFVAV